MSLKHSTLEMGERERQTLVPGEEVSAERFERARHSGHGGTLPEPDATGGAVSGRVLASIPAAVTRMSGSFEAYTWQLLDDADAGPISEDDWYAQETAVAMLARLQETVGPQVVERVGRFLPALLDWPHDVRTFTEALATVDDWYRTVHRDHAAVVAPSTGSASVELRLATPYPTAFEDGLVRGLVLEFVTDGTSVWTTSTTDSEGVTTYRFKLRTAID